MSIKNFNTGYFLKEEYIQKAFELVKTQIESKHNVLKTIELEIYRKEKEIKGFNVSEYYKEFISKDVFYNERQKFYNLEYLTPKGFHGVRKFNFLSFDMLILYYALGFYFSELLGKNFDIIEAKKKERKNIFTYYGGKIDFNNPANSKLLYYDDYNCFNHLVSKQIQNIIQNNKKAVVIKLDIQEFYKNIDFEILLKIVKKYSLPSEGKKGKFNSTTIQEIRNLYLFLNGSIVGLPLFSQNLISNYLSYIYLYELDNFIQELPVAEEKDFIYCRYVDDFYIIYRRNKAKKNDEIGDEIFEIVTSISKFLSVELNAKINDLKTQTLIISNIEEFERFLKKEKVISLPDSDVTSQNPTIKLEKIIEVINKLKADYKNDGKAYIDIDGNNLLNEVYTKSLKSFINSVKAKKEIEKVFKNWNPLLTLANTSTLMFLIKRSTFNKSFEKYLYEGEKSRFSNPQHLYLLEKFILNSTDTLEENINKLLNIKDSNTYLKLIKRLVSNEVSFDEFRLLNIAINSQTLEENDTLSQQVKMMVLSEIEGKYNVAFNHLLNVFHDYCFINDKVKPKNRKDYNQLSVTDFLDKLNLPIDCLSFSLRFFDRRNKNSISHSGDEEMENWVVNQKEYLKYKKELNKLLEKAESRIR